MNHLAIATAVNLRSRIDRIHERIRGDRGDVPGWVLVLLMTAGLVTLIWTVAGPKLAAMLAASLDAVSGPSR
jgi:hypothetical protein